MATVTVTGTIKRPTGKPWYAAPIGFTLIDGTSTLAATYPSASVAITAADGTFSIDLESGLDMPYRCDLPDGDYFLFDLVDGSPNPVTLEVLRATYSPPDSNALPMTIAINSNFVVGTMSTTLVPANDDRGDTYIKNIGGSPLHYNFDAPAVTSISPIPPNEGIILTTKQAINFRATTGTTTVYILSEVKA